MTFFRPVFLLGQRVSRSLPDLSCDRQLVRRTFGHDDFRRQTEDCVVFGARLDAVVVYDRLDFSLRHTSSLNLGQPGRPDGIFNQFSFLLDQHLVLPLLKLGHLGLEAGLVSLQLVVIANDHFRLFDEFRRSFGLNSELVESPFKKGERVRDEVVDLRLELLLALDQLRVLLALDHVLFFNVGAVRFRLETNKTSKSVKIDFNYQIPLKMCLVIQN